jgi:hypothetical protein
MILRPPLDVREQTIPAGTPRQWMDTSETGSVRCYTMNFGVPLFRPAVRAS